MIAILSIVLAAALLQGVPVNQSPEIAKSFEKVVSENENVYVQGYRIRIYFDNKQNSRSESETVLASFIESHPGIPAFRTFESPCFKVTVGNFRTRSEALAALEGIKRQYPSAFIVKEKMRFPQLPGDVWEHNL